MCKAFGAARIQLGPETAIRSDGIVSLTLGQTGPVEPFMCVAIGAVQACSQHLRDRVDFRLEGVVLAGSKPIPWPHLHIVPSMQLTWVPSPLLTIPNEIPRILHSTKFFWGGPYAIFIPLQGRQGIISQWFCNSQCPNHGSKPDLGWFGMIWEGIAVPKQIIGQTYHNCLDLWHCLTPTTWKKTKIHHFLEDTFPTAHFCLASPWHQRHRPGPCDAVLPSPVSAVPAARHRAPPGGGCVRPRFRPAAPRCYRPGVPKWGPHGCHDVITWAIPMSNKNKG